MHKKTFDLARAVNPGTNKLWPAEDWVQFGGMTLEQLYSFNDLYADKVFCDIGFGRGNILHAVYPYVKGLVGYETHHALNDHQYTDSQELTFLKSQTEKSLDLKYHNFEADINDHKTLKSIDFFYIAIGVERIGELAIDRIFKANPTAMIMHHFKMSINSLNGWRKQIGDHAFQGFVSAGNLSNAEDGQGSPVSTDIMDTACLGASTVAVGYITPVVAAKKKVSEQGSPGDHIWSYTFLYAADKSMVTDKSILSMKTMSL